MIHLLFLSSDVRSIRFDQYWTNTKSSDHATPSGLLKFHPIVVTRLLRYESYIQTPCSMWSIWAGLWYLPPNCIHPQPGDVMYCATCQIFHVNRCLWNPLWMSHIPPHHALTSALECNKGNVLVVFKTGFFYCCFLLPSLSLHVTLVPNFSSSHSLILHIPPLCIVFVYTHITTEDVKAEGSWDEEQEMPSWSTAVVVLGQCGALRLFEERFHITKHISHHIDMC